MLKQSVDFDSYSSDLWVVIPVAYTITLVTQLINNSTIFISQMYVILFSQSQQYIMALELVVALFLFLFCTYIIHVLRITIIGLSIHMYCVHTKQ